jgi:hypothetical protein
MATVPPTSDQDLEDWAGNWSTRIGATPTVFDLTAAQATAYAALLAAYVAARAVIVDPGTRTKAATATKNSAKKNLLVSSRQLVAQVNACPTLTEAQRALLGMNPARPAHPTPIPTPATKPIVTLSNTGIVLTTDELTPTLKRRPAGVQGAYLYTAITDAGDPAPAGPNDGTLFATLATAHKHALEIPPGSAGKILWVFAQWANPRGAAGPVSAPASVMIAA